MKKLIGDWAYTLSDKYKVSYNLVRNVITAYLQYNVEKVCRGERVVLIGLGTILPYQEETHYFSTPAYDCKLISEKYGITQATVWGIIQGYFASARKDLVEGTNVTFKGLCTFSVSKDVNTNEIFNVYVNISRTLVDKLASIGCTARVKLNPKLRREIKSEKVII